MSKPAAQLWFEAAAAWDEDHMAPIVEYLQESRGDHNWALSKVEGDLRDPAGRKQFDDQYEKEAEHMGASLDEAHGWYVDQYMRESKRRLLTGNPRSVMTGPRWDTARDKLRSSAKKNPATPEVRAAAIEKYKEFHRYEPTKLTEFPKGFEIPREVVKAGRAKWTTYRSAKVDPATLQKPRKAVDYIHEHDAGVAVYFTEDAPELDELMVDGDSTMTRVPPEFADAQALVRLGDNLGFCIKGENGDEDAEFESSGKLPELYCTPDGHCLLVIQNQREVLAMIWGGALGVFSRGIDG